jgi:hypothetical protein
MFNRQRIRSYNSPSHHTRLGTLLSKDRRLLGIFRQLSTHGQHYQRTTSSPTSRALNHTPHATNSKIVVHMHVSSQTNSRPSARLSSANQHTLTPSTPHGTVYAPASLRRMVMSVGTSFGTPSSSNTDRTDSECRLRVLIGRCNPCPVYAAAGSVSWENNLCIAYYVVSV